MKFCNKKDSIYPSKFGKCFQRPSVHQVGWGVLFDIVQEDEFEYRKVLGKQLFYRGALLRGQVGYHVLILGPSVPRFDKGLYRAPDLYSPRSPLCKRFVRLQRSAQVVGALFGDQHGNGDIAALPGLELPADDGAYRCRGAQLLELDPAGEVKLLPLRLEDGV